MRWLVLLLIIFPATTAYHLSVNEDQYGENLVKIRRQAEVDWVRDNHYIIYDTMSRRNYYVSKIRDDEIMQILRNSFDRERLGVDEANLSAYMKEAREKIYGDLQATEFKQPRHSLPEVSIKDSSYECIRRNAFTIYDPVARANRWVKNVSDEELSRILTRNRFLNPSVLRCF